MSLQLMGYGSGVFETTYFSISVVRDGQRVRVGQMLLQTDEIPELIEELSEWVDPGE